MHLSKHLQGMQRLGLSSALAATVLLAGCSVPALFSSTAGATAAATQPAGGNAVSANLTHHVWRLEQALSAQGQPVAAWAPAQGKLVLNFLEGNNLNVQGLCNTMLGRYTQQGAALHVQPLASTMMACPDAAQMQLEQQVAQQLPQAQAWHITAQQPAQLELRFADGQRWLLQGQVKPEALYGQPERIFLEIAPEKQACAHPLVADADTQCLQVRSVHYNAQGIKTAVGQWESFYDAIEGFEHRAGERHVLRIKRFTRQHVPADASRYVYVLDMVVESESRP